MSGRHEALAHPPSDLIGGAWIGLEEAGPGGGIVSTDPSRPDRVVWSGTPVAEHVDRALAAARGALAEWSGWSMVRRVAVLQRFAKLCEGRADALAGLLCDETGKAMWDCRAEVGLLAAKVAITTDRQTEQNWGLRRVSGYEIALGETRGASCWFRPHGVMAVVGPFNFPLHLPNGHAVPTLAMGGTVVLKPSEQAPACGQALAELLEEALRAEGAPAGVVNLVHGDGRNAAALTGHEGIDGVLFTGSWRVGRRILEANLDRPGRVIALEMGGNNAAVVLGDADLRQAAIEVTRGAFVGTGQRCTCTRRLIVEASVADRLIPAVCKAASGLVIADPRAEPCFMGPVISERAREAALTFQSRLAGAGGAVLVPMTAPDAPGWYLTPGVVRVERFTRAGAAGWPESGAGFDSGCDEEVFGPLLRVSVVEGLDAAIEQANATRYGLAASVFTRDEQAAERFRREARAGCVNVNCATAGASSKLPFGGLGLSGNHRPAGAFSLDYAAAPIAGLTERGQTATLAPGMTFDDGWLG